MTDTALDPRPAPGQPRTVRPQIGDRFKNGALGFVVFLGGFVLFEPAPYELLFVPLAVVWIVAGLGINRHLWPLIMLLIVFAAGGFLALAQLEDPGGALLYQAVTLFLCLSAIFFAALVASSPDSRSRIIVRAYIASAVFVAFFGIITYFNLIPGSENFKVASRAASTFQDPNVLGPFLALPAAFLARQILTQKPSESVGALLALLIVASGLFLTFSRAAWGLALLVLLVTATLAFISAREPGQRTRMTGVFLVLIMGGVVLAAVAATIPAVGDLLSERAQIVQYYDGGRLGRFARIAAGFSEVPSQPLGIGAFEFAARFGNDEHNTWLKAFTAYGWLGGFAFVTLTVWTLIAAFPVLFRTRPWLPIAQVAYAAFVGHVMIYLVIDTDHWRHVYLIIGLLWGLIAAERTMHGSYREPERPR